MAIRTLQNTSCSLNLGQIYKASYGYTPKRGVEVTLHFVNESGTYTKPSLYPIQKESIKLGPLSLSLYPRRYRLSESPDGKFIEVLFVDETHTLDNYLVCLPGRGCGTNVYVLGAPVDNRTLAQKQATSLAPAAEKIKALTQFPDYQYSFGDFLTVLRQKFTVTVTGTYDATQKNDFVGTFREVLDRWCAFYNLSFFFEGGSIKVFDPTKLIINLPTKPTDAIEYSVEEDIGDTYGVTACNTFQQQGGQFGLNQSSDDNGALLVRTATLYPVGAELNLPQLTMNPGQVGAAMLGREFWFLYNLYKGTTSTECGWSPIAVPTVQASLTAKHAAAAVVDETQFQQRHEAYQQYGESIGGRWYLSNRRDDIAIDRNYQWFDESGGQLTTFTNATDKQIEPDYLTSQGSSINAIDGTIVNQYYSGVNYDGNRLVYRDPVTVNYYNAVGYTATVQGLVSQAYQELFKLEGSSSFKFPTDQQYVAYSTNFQMPQAIVNVINAMPNTFTGIPFKSRFTSFPIKGITRADYSNLQAGQNEDEDVEVVTTDGPNVVSNTSVIKTVRNGTFTVYYDKFSNCKSAATAATYFNHRFSVKQISDDVRVDFSFKKEANNTYELNRDLTVVNALVDNPMLTDAAQARTFATKRVSFSLNYFHTIPTNYLSNGLVGMNLEYGPQGVVASYSFSNEILAVPDGQKEADQLAQRIRNSYIRSYRPPQTIN